MAADVNSSSSVGLHQGVEELGAELRQRTQDLHDLQKHQTATSEVMRLISRSTFDLAPVLQTLANTAMRLCEAEMCFVVRREGEAYRVVTAAGATPELLKDARDYQQHQQAHLLVPGRGSMTGRVALAKQAVQIADLAADPEYTLTAATTMGKIRTQLGVPLLRDGSLIGVIMLSRQKVEPFAEQQIKLAETFADQAVIAIENTRLLAEQREALDRQTATAEVLQVINSSPGDLAPVFDAVLESATRLCDAAFGILWLCDGERFHAAALHGAPASYAEVAQTPHLPLPTNPLGRMLRGERLIVALDVAAEQAYKTGDPVRRALVDLGGARSVVQVALVKDEVFLGSLTVYRTEVRPFSEKQIALLQNFAAQAVVAMENARLLTETREALEQQTATAEVLEVINSSLGDLGPVFQAMLKKALHLCEAAFGVFWTYDGTHFHASALLGVPQAFADFAIKNPHEPGRHNTHGRALRGETVMHIDDASATDAYQSGDPLRRALVDLGGARTSLGIALRRDDLLLGVLILYRQEVRAFSDRQIALLQNFAAQAVIAMENARLLTEQREALAQQTATADVLQLINSSPGDLTPVFNTMLDKAMTLCGAAFGFLTSYDGHRFTPVAMRGVPPSLGAYFAKGMDQPRPGEAHFRILEGENVIHNLDQKDEEAYRSDSPLRRAVVDLGGARTAIVVALRKEDLLLGSLTVYRQEVRPFSEKQISLLQNFAAQAVIAIENTRLLSDQRDALERQTASAQVLQVINESPGNLVPVFEAMLERAVDLGEAAFGIMNVYEDGVFRAVALLGVPDGLIEQWSAAPRPTARNALSRMVDGEDMVHIDDLAAYETYHAGDLRTRALVETGGARSLLAVALRKDDVLLGTLTVYRQEVRPFSDKQIALLQNFAAQAVIAIENARLLSEQREALEQQTASAGILRVISQSLTTVQPVFDAIADSALQLLDGWSIVVWRYHDGALHLGAIKGGHPGSAEAMRGLMKGLSPEDIFVGDAIRRGAVQHIVDIEAEAVDPVLREVARVRGWRSNLAVPMMREGQPVGVITLSRAEPGSFSEREVGLLQSFADQAVIAIENVRLFTELRESLERQTASTEVLETINSSPGDLQPVFEAILAKAMTLCDAAFGIFATFDGETLHTVATRGVPEAFARYRLSNPPQYGPGTGPGRLIAGENYVHDIDAADSEAYRQGDSNRRAIVDLGGARTLLNVALRKDDELLGTISIYRKEVRPFSDNQITLLQGFAAQAVIAMENARLLDEQREALEQQTATAEVLQVINSSPGRLEPVFEAMLQKALRLCDANAGFFGTRDGEGFSLAALQGLGPDVAQAFADTWRKEQGPRLVHAESGAGRIERGEPIVHILDSAGDDVYRSGDPGRRTLVDVGGARTQLCAGLLKDGVLLGIIIIWRRQVRAFTDKQIALLKNFADQAVIAMENARLLRELRDRQAELRVTFDNMGDGVAMFDAEPRLAAWNRNFEEIIGLPEALLAERPSYADYLRLLAERGEFGTENVEAELTSRLQDTDRELRLERTRADGSVIEVRRNAVPGGGFVLIYSDVTEQRRAEAAIRAARDDAEAALERQTATADILKVIASSPTDVQPVLDAVAKAAVQFCGATDAVVHLKEGDEYVLVAHDGPLRGALGRRQPITENPHVFALLLEGRMIHFPDVQDLDAVKFAKLRQIGMEVGFHAVLGAPLLREGTAVGSISLRRIEPGSFTPQQIELLGTFAAQAVIAIENVRLFTELRESLEQQTATAEILRAISRSPTDVQPVLNAVVKATLRFCGAVDAVIILRQGDGAVFAAHEGPFVVTPGSSFPLNRETSPGLAILDGRTTHFPDIASLDPVEFGAAHRIATAQGFRAALAAPLLREGTTIGSVALRKPEAGPFAPQQIALLETFAAQAVIAIENVRLFTELRDSLERLKAAQANLIQAEKMASLGQLTAGIAHEIKNPLNFVNNFAGLSSELLDELKHAVDALLAEPDEDKRAELQETMDLLTGNLAKIVEHGRRADGIVKSMLAHSRGGTGDWQASNINALVEEALNLAYHGARAQDQDFNVTLERDFASETTPIEVVPQDVTRVFLNLFGNGFYAARKRHLSGTGSDYRPTLIVSTRDLGDAVEIRVRDNGIGILPEVRAKLFQPFFTTKPTGEGTGLGLSISYDIVTQQHGGTIEVESEPGSFTEFTVRLPRGRRAA